MGILLAVLAFWLLSRKADDGTKKDGLDLSSILGGGSGGGDIFSMLGKLGNDSDRTNVLLELLSNPFVMEMLKNIIGSKSSSSETSAESTDTQRSDNKTDAPINTGNNNSVSNGDSNGQYTEWSTDHPQQSVTQSQWTNGAVQQYATNATQQPTSSVQHYPSASQQPNNNSQQYVSPAQQLNSNAQYATYSQLGGSTQEPTNNKGQYISPMQQPSNYALRNNTQEQPDNIQQNNITHLDYASMPTIWQSDTYTKITTDEHSANGKENNDSPKANANAPAHAPHVGQREYFFAPIDQVATLEIKQELYKYYDNWYIR
ncbi:MAG: hypothetical protein PHW00_02230 [Clostridia bacterium]|nr:hypothetical protein [Clostridia bacterium]